MSAPKTGEIVLASITPTNSGGQRLSVPSRVLDVRSEHGPVDILVTPLWGSGEKWVRSWTETGIDAKELPRSLKGARR